MAFGLERVYDAMSTKGEIEDMLTDCEKREDKLSAWEHDFITSVRMQFDTRGTLSPKQDLRLEEVWNKVTGCGT